MLQFVTATFMHANWAHLSSNAFALLTFGRMVEEEEGAFGLWATYLLAGVGGTVASYLTSPHSRTVSLGASGAVFGLFMVSAMAHGQQYSSAACGQPFVFGSQHVPAAGRSRSSPSSSQAYASCWNSSFWGSLWFSRCSASSGWQPAEA